MARQREGERTQRAEARIGANLEEEEVPEGITFPGEARGKPEAEKAIPSSPFATTY